MSPLSNATTLANYASGIGTQGATLEIDSNNKRVGIGTTNPQGPEGSLQVGTAVTISGNSGIVSATTFHGDFGSSTSVAGNLTVSGVITYEDVTNIDSVGIITARNAVVISEDNAIHFRGTATEDNDAILRASAGGGQLLINSRNDTIINIDTNNDSTDAHFAVAHGAATGSSTELLRVQEDGKMGLGTVSPDANLHIKGGYPTVHIERDSAINYSRLLLDNTANDGGAIDGIGDGTGGLRFSTSDAGTITERVRIDSSGRLMIGTTTEGQDNADNLTIADSSRAGITIRSSQNEFGSIYFSDSTSGAGEYDGIVQYNHSDQALIFATASTQRMRIDSAGRLLVGTTTPGNAAADDLTLHSSGDTGITIRASESGSSNIYFADGAAGTNVYTGAIIYDHATNHMSLHTNSGAERMRLDSSGRMGLGTISPVDRLHVVGNIRAAHSSGGRILLEDTNVADGSTPFYLFASDSGNLTFTSANRNASDGTTGSTERMRIDSAGRMGLGTASPGHNLEIKGSFPDFAISDSDTANDKFRILYNGGGAQIQVDPNNVGPNSSYFLVSVDNTERMRIDSSGNMGLGTNNPGSYNANLAVFSTGGAFVGALHSNTSGTFPKASAISFGSDAVSYTYTTNGSTVALRGSAHIAALQSASSGATTDLAFFTTASGGVSEKMRIDSSGRLLVNTSTSRIVEDHVGNGPQGKIQIEATNSDAIMSIISAGTADANRCGTISLGRHRNSTVGGTPTIVQDNDSLGAIVFAGGDGNDMRSTAAKIHAEVDGTPGQDDMPGALVFSTTPDGSASPYNQERLRINSSGSTKFTPSSSSATLQIEQGTVNTDSIRLQSGGTTSTYLEYRGYLGHAWFVDTTERMRIDSAGSVLIGTSTSSSLSDRLLTVGKGNRAASYIELRNSIVGVGGLLFSDGTTGDAGYRGQVDYAHNIDEMRLWTAALPRLRIQGDGTLRFQPAGATSSANLVIDRSGTTIRFKSQIDGSGGSELSMQTQSGGSVSERGRFTSVGLEFPSGLGISFGPTGDTSGMSSEILDDYEEGTCTMYISTQGGGLSILYGNQTAYYVKIGQIVTVSWYSGLMNISNAGSGIALIQGLPYASYNGSDHYAVMNIEHATCFATTVSGGYISTNSTQGVPIQPGATNGVGLSAGSIKYLMMTATYRTN